MTVKNLIEKYKLSLFIKDGAEMVRFGRKPSAKDLPGLKARKEEIVQELKNQEAERKAAFEKERFPSLIGRLKRFLRLLLGRRFWVSIPHR